MTVRDPVGRTWPYPRVPNSDGAGTVTAVGPGVGEIAVGDRVASCFPGLGRWRDQSTGHGQPGGALDGVLAEEVATVLVIRCRPAMMRRRRRPPLRRADRLARLNRSAA